MKSQVKIKRYKFSVTIKHDQSNVLEDFTCTSVRKIEARTRLKMVAQFIQKFEKR